MSSATHNSPPDPRSVRSTLLPRAHPATRSSWLIAASVVTFFAATACDGERTTAPDERRGIARPPDQPNALVVQDQDINQNDTYVLIDAYVQRSATVYLSEPLYDEDNQEIWSVTLSSPVEHIEIEGGYDYYNRLRTNGYGDPPGDPMTQPVNEARTVKAIRSDYTEYDQYGAVLPAEHLDGAPTQSPLAPLGSLQYAQITNGALVDANADPYGPRPSIASIGNGSAASLSPVPLQSGETFKRLDPTTLQVTTPLTSIWPANTNAAANKKAKLTGARKYKLHRDKWVLDEMSVTSEYVTDGATVKTEEKVEYRNVRWHVNPEKDAERLAGRLAHGDGVLPPHRSGEAGLLPIGPHLFMTPEECEQYVQPPPECGGYEPPPPPPPYTGPRQNVVFQHGGFSDQGTWWRMDPWLSSDFHLGTKVRISTNSRDRIANQGEHLLSAVQSSGANSFAFIGHSNGGLVSRYAAQRRPDLTQGVITISSPHGGVHLARQTRSALQSYFASLITSVWGGCSSPQQDAACYIADLLARIAVGTVIDWARDASVPMIQDIVPGSAFLAQLNSQPESFLRVSVEDYSRQRWLFMRMAGDAACTPESNCGGRRAVRYTQRAYNGFTLCWIIASLTGYFQIAYWCSSIAGAMDRVDGGYRRIVSGFQTPQADGSDGVVRNKAQRYPNASFILPINNADSHVGETDSDLVHGQLRNTLLNHFRAPRNQF
jgi:pimeloyl-ACP methyl ester carboxylesterase